MRASRYHFAALCLDLFGTLIDATGFPADGAAELISSLGKARWAIVTSMPRQAALGVFKSFGWALPNVVVSADDVGMQKPSPDPYRTAVTRLGASAQECLAIEDSHAGSVSALRAGLTVFAVGSVDEPGVVRIPSLRSLAVRASESGIDVEIAR